MSRVVFVVGHKGQDGSLLRESLSADSVEVVGISRTTIEVFDSEGNLTTTRSRPARILPLLEEFAPEELYYLAATHTSAEGDLSKALSIQRFRDYCSGPTEQYLTVLEDVVASQTHPSVFFASSSLVFEGNRDELITEESAFCPRSFYGMAKAEGVWLGQKFRDELGVRVSNGLLFNHESHLRPDHFFSAKIIRGALDISGGIATSLELGPLDISVDWGYAPDFVRGFRAVVRAASPDDYIFATGQKNSASRFVELVFEQVGLDWRDHVRTRAGDIRRRADLGVADPSKLRTKVGWETPLSFEEFVRQLVQDHQGYLRPDRDEERANGR